MASMVAQRGLHRDFVIDSAGTHARLGLTPEPLAIDVATDYGVDISQQRSRPLDAADYQNFDVLVALDLAHFDHLQFMR
ncbi:MAG: low molecular weight phosphotyrosine protein phosphatase, partial [Gammaproteobacteria bacterium]